MSKVFSMNMQMIFLFLVIPLFKMYAADGSATGPVLLGVGSSMAQVLRDGVDFGNDVEEGLVTQVGRASRSDSTTLSTVSSQEAEEVSGRQQDEVPDVVIVRRLHNRHMHRPGCESYLWCSAHTAGYLTCGLFSFWAGWVVHTLILKS